MRPPSTWVRCTRPMSMSAPPRSASTLLARATFAALRPVGAVFRWGWFAVPTGLSSRCGPQSAVRRGAGPLVLARRLNLSSLISTVCVVTVTQWSCGVPRDTLYGTPRRRPWAHTTPELPHHYTLSAPALPIAFRACAATSCADPGGLRAAPTRRAAALCTSELVTNVHRHGKGDVRLAATIGRTAYGSRSTMTAPRCPRPAARRTMTPTGVVCSWSRRFRTSCGLTVDEPAEGTGKAVWFELNVPPGNTKSTT